MKIRLTNLYSGFVLFISLLTITNFSSAQNEKGNAVPDSVKFLNMKNFTQKGSWMTGGTLSLKFRNSNEKNELIRYVEDNHSYDFSVRVDAGYAFVNQNFAGLAIVYGQSGRSGDYQNSDGVPYTEDAYGVGYSFIPFLRNLTPIDKHGRFNIITQIELLTQIEQGITQTVLNEELTRRHSVKYTGLLGVRPGISVFVLRNVAFETTLNVAGVRYSYEKIKTTNQPDAKTETASIDFKIDILQLNIGIMAYLWPNK